MPNIRNINAPITLIANGRSGTSLVQSIFNNHPVFDTCGENAAQIFGTWHATERLKGLVRPDHALGRDIDFRLRCGKAVRAVVLETFRRPGKKHWMQKPIGVPWVWWALGKQGLSEEERIKWYWQVLEYSFPEGQNITVLRHPYDVVLSAEKYWGISLEKAWASIVRMARILGHDSANITHAVSYDQLVQEPLGETERLFSAIDRPFSIKTLQAFERIWVPEMNTRDTALQPDHPRFVARFSRQAEWGRLQGVDFPLEEREVIIAMWRRYGVGLSLKSPCSL